MHKSLFCSCDYSTRQKIITSALGRQDIGGVFHKEKGTSRNVNGKCSTRIVQHLGLDVSRVETFLCAPLRSILLKGCLLTGLEVAWTVGTWFHTWAEGGRRGPVWCIKRSARYFCKNYGFFYNLELRIFSGIWHQSRKGRNWPRPIKWGIYSFCTVFVTDCVKPKLWCRRRRACI